MILLTEGQCLIYSKYFNVVICWSSKSLLSPERINQNERGEKSHQLLHAWWEQTLAWSQGQAWWYWVFTGFFSKENPKNKSPSKLLSRLSLVTYTMTYSQITFINIWPLLNNVAGMELILPLRCPFPFWASKNRTRSLFLLAFCHQNFTACYSVDTQRWQ